MSANARDQTTRYDRAQTASALREIPVHVELLASARHHQTIRQQSKRLRKAKLRRRVYFAG